MIRTIIKSISVSAICVVSLDAYAEQATLMFSESDQNEQTFTLSVLKDKLATHQITIYDPHYEAEKAYDAFLLNDVMVLAYGKDWRNKPYTDVKFTALDGYQAVSTFDKISIAGGYIVYKAAAGWQPIGHHKANPGPFYMVWKGEMQTPEQAFPWPYQLASVNMLQFKDQYPLVYPEGVESVSTVYQGFEIFKDRCIKCHSMDQQGGKLGPDLNAPMSVVSYRSKDMLRKFIKQPSQFRYTQMPDHLDLSAEQIDSILDYLSYQGKISNVRIK